MFNKPLVVGVRQVGEEIGSMRVEDALTALGQNTGNMMFTQALQSVIAGADAGTFEISSDVGERNDVIVVAAANWINDFDDFGWMAQRIEVADLPVVVVGIGAQASNDREHPTLRPGTRRFLDVVRERSRSISVRGTFSAEVLASLGFDAVEVTGCPSMMLIGPDGPRLRLDGAPLSPAQIVLHGTRHHFYRADASQIGIYRSAARYGYDVLLQSEAADMYLALGRAGNPELSELARTTSSDNYGLSPNEIDRYLQQHGHVFFSYPQWIAYLQKRGFCLGSRIHGTISALIAGTPAVLLTHDSRTSEMAAAMHIPSASIESASDLSQAGVQKIRDTADFAAFQANFAGYYRTFERFFAESGLRLRQGWEGQTFSEQSQGT